jgi:hypothetical protein
MYNTFVKSKPAATLIKLLERDMSISACASQTDQHFSNCCRLVNIFEKEGFVNTQKQGRIRIVALTQKGRDMAVLLQKIKGDLK